MSKSNAVRRLEALRKRLDERSVQQPEFSVVVNVNKPGRPTSIATTTARGAESTREFFALVKQIEPLLIELGAPIDSGRVLAWAWEETVNEYEKVPDGKGGVVQVGVPADHPYRMLAIAVDMFLATCGDKQQQPQWDKATEARNEWLYKQYMQGVVYSTIIRRLEEKPKSWGRIGHPNGIIKAVRAYARWRNKPEPPPRQAGRPRR